VDVAKKSKFICLTLRYRRIQQRQRYTRQSKQLVRETYDSKHPKRGKQARKAKRRLRTIANAQLRELDRKMSEAQKARHKKLLDICKRWNLKKLLEILKENFWQFISRLFFKPNLYTIAA
jgi:hypothetical protein